MVLGEGNAEGKDIKTAPILVNMLNELQNQLASKCGRSAECLYICKSVYGWVGGASTASGHN